MKTVFFCENRNCMRLTRRILAETDLPDLEPRLVTLDWAGTVAEWVQQEASEDQPVLNLCDRWPEAAEGIAAAGDSLQRSLAVRALFDRFFEEEAPDLVLLFNDSSIRGKECSLSAAGRGITRFLVQDGHLSFVSRSNRPDRSDRNWFYGRTRPDRVFVWGEVVREELCRRHGLHPANVVVSGRVGGFHRAPLPDRVWRRPDPSRPVRLLIADQPLIDQDKMSRKNWEEDFAAFAGILSGWDVTLKFHPSTLPATRDLVRRLLPKKVRLLQEGFLSQEELRSFDLVITYFSSIYTDCLEAGVPVLFYGFPRCDFLFPEVRDPLMACTCSLEELLGRLNELSLRGIFRGNDQGLPLRDYLVPDEGEKAVAGALREAAEGSFLRAPDFERSVSDWAMRPYSMDALAITEENPKSICVLGDDFGTTTGVALPILNYFRFMSRFSDSRIEFVLVHRSMPAASIIRQAEKFSYIIINSLAFFFRNPQATEVVSALKNRFVYVYAHETGHVIEFEKLHNRRNFEKFRALAPALFFLCVSRRQKRLFQSYGWRKAAVIYNCVEVETDLPPAQADEKCVFMAGTIQDRKGVALFCKAADIFSPRGWRFVWAGRLTPKCTVPLSPNVRFLGQKSREEVLEFVRRCGIFFLSSSDDPFPLSLLEAAAFNRKIVSYAGVGSFEVLFGVPGYEPFQQYSAAEACQALERAMRFPQEEVRTSSVSPCFTPGYFAMRLNMALKQYRFEAMQSRDLYFLGREGKIPDCPALSVLAGSQEMPGQNIPCAEKPSADPIPRDRAQKAPSGGFRRKLRKLLRHPVRFFRDMQGA